MNLIFLILLCFGNCYGCHCVMRRYVPVTYRMNASTLCGCVENLIFCLQIYNQRKIKITKEEKKFIEFSNSVLFCFRNGTERERRTLYYSFNECRGNMCDFGHRLTTFFHCDVLNTVLDLNFVDRCGRFRCKGVLVTIKTVGMNIFVSVGDVSELDLNKPFKIMVKYADDELD